MPNFRLIPFAVIFLMLVGCHKPTLGEQEYADRFKEGMVAFNAQAVVMSLRPLPSTKGKPKAERRALLAGRFRADAAVWRGFQKRFEALIPPAAYDEVNRRSVEFFKDMADDAKQLASLAVAGSPQATADSEASDARMLADLRRLVGAVKNVSGADGKHLDESLRSLQGQMAAGSH